MVLKKNNVLYNTHIEYRPVPTEKNLDKNSKKLEIS